ncbi:MAG: thioredoxin-dependent thiol peroxidase [Brevinema sp.]
MLKAGDKAPLFELPDISGNTVSLNDYQGKWVIIYFYPKDNTPGCTLQAVDFSTLYDEFQALGVDIIGINADTIASHQSFCKKHNLKIKLLSDPQKTMLSEYKVWGEKQFMGQKYEGLTRSTFIIDPNGIIKEAMYNVKAKDHGARVLRTMKQILEGA